MSHGEDKLRYLEKISLRMGGGGGGGGGGGHNNSMKEKIIKGNREKERKKKFSKIFYGVPTAEVR